MISTSPRLTRCLTLALLASALSMPARAAILDWEGEWGSWSKTQKKQYVGGSVTIFACEEGPGAPGKCGIRFDSETERTRCSFEAEKGAELKESSRTAALAQLVDYAGAPKRCELALTRTGGQNGGELHATLSGPDCGEFCTQGVSFPERFPFRGRPIYPLGATRDCFADDRPSRRAWCLESSIQQADRALASMAQEVSALTYEPVLDRLEAQRETLLAACSGAPYPAGCLEDAYRKAGAEWAKARSDAQAIHDRREAKLAAPGDPAQAKRWVEKLSGVYKERFQSQLVDGTPYPAENILEIVPVGADRFYFRVHLDFYNGHVCERHGVARFSAAGTFVYRPHPPDPNDGAFCELQLAADDREIRLLDPESSCKAFCGMRGNLNGATFPRSARRPIRYLERLKRSTEYRTSIEESAAGAP